MRELSLCRNDDILFYFQEKHLTSVDNLLPTLQNVGFSVYYTTFLLNKPFYANLAYIQN